MKKKKKHHYIPQFYLGGFTNDNGELFVLNKEKDIIEKQGKNGTFHKKYFYTVDFSKYKKRSLEETERTKKLFGLENVDTSEVREYPDMIEDLLGESESISISIINKLVSDIKITSLEKVEFSSFIALMYTRNPLFHNFIENREIEEAEQTINKIFISKESLKETCDKIIKDGYNKDIDIDNLFSFWNNKKYKIQIPKEKIIQEMLLESIDMDKDLEKRTWFVLRAPDNYSFITTDYPVFRIKSEIFFPLSKRALLIMKNTSDGKMIKSFHLDEKATKELNEVIFKYSNKYVISPNYDLINKLKANYGGRQV